METTTTVHAQLIRYTTNGDQIIVNLKSAGSDISIDRSTNTKLPSTVSSAQTLADALGNLAFKNSLGKGDVGLGNVDNTADSAKSVKYATSAGSANAVAWANVSGKPSSMPASDVSAWAKAASKPSYSKSEVGLGNVDNTADANKSVKYATSAGTANASNKINVTLSTGCGDANNTTGYRLLKTQSLGTWSNYRATFVVNSRHEGAGIISIAFGCNAATVSQSNAYAEIKYFGLTDSASVIATDSFQVYIAADGKTAYLFEKYWDYSTCNLILLYGDFTVSSGAWLTSIPTATYGALKAQTSINSVPWNSITGKPNASATASGLMSSTDKAKLDFGDILYVSKSAPTKACIWAKLD